jgi:hypothetical protein
MREMPKCPTSLLGVLDEKLRELAEIWATSETRPRIEKTIAVHWDSLIEAWLGDIALPLLVRKASEGRGSVVHHKATGRALIPTDNSPAHWSFALAYAGERPTLSDIHEFIAHDQIPVAWIFKKQERTKATYLGANATVRDITARGWKVCHKERIGLGRRGTIADLSIATLETHFKNFIAPSNIFVVPKGLSGLGEFPLMTKIMRNHT